MRYLNSGEWGKNVEIDVENAARYVMREVISWKAGGAPGSRDLQRLFSSRTLSRPPLAIVHSLETISPNDRLLISDTPT